MIKSERQKVLITYADKVISCSGILREDKTINASYNGQIAAFPVSVAMIGLIPTIRYYNNPDSKSNINKTKILEMIDAMYLYDTGNDPSNTQIDKVENLYNLVGTSRNDVLTRNDVLNRIYEYASALKQVIRTYKLVKDE